MNGNPTLSTDKHHVWTRCLLVCAANGGKTGGCPVGNQGEIIPPKKLQQLAVTLCRYLGPESVV